MVVEGPEAQYFSLPGALCGSVATLKHVEAMVAKETFQVVEVQEVGL